MTQTEAIAEAGDAITKELERLNAKFADLLELIKEGITVYVEKANGYDTENEKSKVA